MISDPQVSQCLQPCCTTVVLAISIQVGLRRVVCYLCLWALDESFGVYSDDEDLLLPQTSSSPPPKKKTTTTIDATPTHLPRQAAEPWGTL